MRQSYADTRARLETYFDRTAAAAWARLTSEAPVSRIRETVRQGRDAMRDLMLSRLPERLEGVRVLDAGCGAGPMTIALAERGAEVVAVDIAPSLLAVARRRTPERLLERIRFIPGDMLDPALGRFDYVMAMDSLIHYRAEDAAAALARLAARTERALVFTMAPRTPLLSAMHLVGKAFPKRDRSPAIIPCAALRLRRACDAAAPGRALAPLGRVSRGFYISEAWEMRP